MLLPGGVKQLFSNGSEIKNQSNIDMLNDYDLFKSDIDLEYNSKDGSVKAVKSVRDIADHYKDASDAAKDFMDKVEAGTVKIKEGQTASEAFTEQFSSGISNVGKGIINLGKTIGATLGKAAFSMGISWLVTTGISLIVKGIDQIINKEKYAKQAAEEVKQTIKETNDQYTNVSKTVDGLKDRYAELAQKVGNLGTLGQNQGGLSNDEYEEFLSLSTQLAELFPRLTKGYDDNGVAILDLSGNVDTIVGSLNNLVEAEERAANRTALESMDELWVDYSYRVDEARESLEKLNDEFNGNIDDVFEGYAQAYDAFKEAISSDSPILFDFDFEGSDGYFSEALRRAGTGWNELKVFDDDLGHYRYDFSKLSEDQISAIDDAFANIRSEYLAQVKSYEDTIGDANREIGTYMSQAMKTVDYYDSLSDVEKQMMDAFIMNFDFETLQDQFNGDWTQTYNAFQTILRDSFGSVSDADRVLVQQYYHDLFAIDFSDGSYEENIEKVREYARLIAEILGDEFSETDILDLLGFGNPDDKLVAARQHAGTYGKNSYEKSDRDKEVDQWISSLSEEQLELFMTLHLNGDESVEELQEDLDKLQGIADDNSIEVKIKASDAVDSMADAKSAINSLESLYDQVVNMKTSDGLATGFADPALLNSVESSFSKFIEDLKKDGQDVTQLNNALEKFEDTLVRFPNDSDKAQVAIDELITAYIDQTDIIQNLTEENRDWSIAQLEAMGITNAMEVVDTRLNKTVKETQKAIGRLSKYILENADALDQSKRGTQEYSDAINGMISDVTTALQLYDEDGNVTFTPQVDSAFVEQHLADIQAMAAGDEEALNRVRRAAAEEAVLKVTANVDDQYALASIQNLMNECMKLDDMNIEVGAEVDDSAFIASLNNMIKSGQYTAEQVSAALESMGYTAEWIPNPYDATVAEAIIASGGTGNTAADEAMKRGVAELKTHKARMDVPSLKITRTGKSGGGSVAHYGGGSGGSSSGGGGGGGGGGSSSEPNKPKEEAEETFDWIEVAIQRIEEEIARLDKVVGNSYDIWINRNKALLKEIDKTKEEIKAQQLAYSEYLKNAGKVEVNNGKGLNDDDYGENDAEVKKHDQELLNDAIKAWKTGEYQKKVREGLLTGEDIETIQNHFLSDTIKNYQEL